MSKSMIEQMAADMLHSAFNSDKFDELVISSPAHEKACAEASELYDKLMQTGLSDEQKHALHKYGWAETALQGVTEIHCLIFGMIYQRTLMSIANTNKTGAGVIPLLFFDKSCVDK